MDALNGLIGEINQLDPSLSVVERQTINIDKAGIIMGAITMKN